MKPIILIGLVLILILPAFSYAKYLISAEYFIDTDPGEGNGIPISGTYGDTTVTVSLNGISTTGLSYGTHTIFVRFQDSEGNWGQTGASLLNISNPDLNPTTITTAEYFIDTDPGEGNGIALYGAFGSSTVTAFITGISTDDLSFGTHTVYVRFQDSEANWGQQGACLLNISSLYPENYIFGAEYFIDADPGIGNGIQLLPQDGNFNSPTETAYLEDIESSSLSIGEHTLCVRFQDVLQQWSVIESDTFEVIYSGPHVDFSATPTLGRAPLTVNFTDHTTQGSGALVEWQWFFGDGDSSNEQSPTHIYEDIGIYTVALTVTDENDSTDTETKIDYITVAYPHLVVADSFYVGETPKNVSISNNLILQNDSVVNLEIIDLSIDNDEFSVISDTSFTIPPDSSAEVTISFISSIYGEHAGILTINSDDPENESKEVDLSATVLAAILIVDESLDFGNITLGETKTDTLLVSNVGNINLELTDITVTGDAFSLLSNNTLIVPPDSSGEIVVKFEIYTPGSHSGTITWIDNDDVGIDSISLSGFIKAPEYSSATTIDFGATIIDTTISSDLTIHNLGDTTLIISDMNINNSVFTSSQTLPIYILESDSIEILINFTPADTISYNGNLELTTNDYDESIVIVTLLGRGSPPALISIALDTLSFGYVLENTTSQQSFQIYNVGNTTLTVNSITNSTPYFTLNNVITPFDIEPEQSEEILVDFTPNQEGVFLDSLIINSNSYSGIEKVYLIGFGSPTPVPVISFIDGNYDFGNVALYTSEDHEIIIKNTGTDTLYISDITITDTVFTLTYNDTITVLMPDEILLVMVTFSPTIIGTFSAQLTVNDTINNLSNYTTVQGTGIGAIIVIDSEIGFGNITLGETKTDTLLVSNAGNINLELTDITVTGDAFSLLSNNTLIIPPDSSGEIIIKFEIYLPGNYSGTITWIDNDDVGIDSVSLSGFIKAPEYSSATNIDFGAAIIDTTISRDLTIHNLGDTTLIISDMNFNNSVFTSSQTLPIYILESDSIEILINFTPADTISYNGNLELTTNDYDESIVIVTLLGRGSPPALISIALDTLSFGYVLENTTSQQSFQIYNVGNTTLTVNSIINSTPYFNLNNVITPFDIEPEQSEEILVDFTPNQEGVFLDSLIINSNSYSGIEKVYLIGFGSPTPVPVISFIDGNYDFGNVALYTSEDHEIIIKNTGTETLYISEITISDTVFTLTYNDTITMLIPDDILPVTITFSPKTIGEFSAQLTVNDTINNLSNYTTVQGNGEGAILTTESIFNYPTVPVFSSTSSEISITNEGNIDLEITDMIFINQLFETNIDFPFIVLPEFEATIPINYESNNLGEVEDTLIIVSNDYLGDKEVIIVANSILPDIRIYVEVNIFIDSLDFGTVRSGDKVDTTFMIAHFEDENYQVTIDSIIISGSEASHFHNNSTIPFVLEYQDEHQINFEYQPQSVGNHTAISSFYSGGINLKDIVLIGNCIPNQAPNVSNLNLTSSIYSHGIEIQYELSDLENDTLALNLEYFINDIWEEATLNIPLDNITPPNYSGVFMWLSNEDLKGYYESLPLRLVVSDHFGALTNSDTTNINLANLVGDLVFITEDEIGVGFEDIIPFSDAWKTTGEIDNIGPVTGTIPNVIPSDLPAEQIIDFEDLCVFVQMWNWSTENLNFKYFEKIFIIKQGDDVDANIQYISDNNFDINISLNTEARAFELIMFLYSDFFEVVSISKSVENDNIILLFHQNERFLKVNIINLDRSNLPTDKFLISIAINLTSDNNIFGIDGMYELRHSSNAILSNNLLNIPVDLSEFLPKEFILFQNYPNPFNLTTSIRFSLPKSKDIKLQIYNIKGQLVETLVDEDKPAGYHTIDWNAKDMSSGIYFFKLSTQDKTFIKKMILMR